MCFAIITIPPTVKTIPIRHASRFLSIIAPKLINELQDIRLRPAIYCIHCHVDLTLKICKHHKVKSIQKNIDFHNKIVRTYIKQQKNGDVK